MNLLYYIVSRERACVYSIERVNYTKMANRGRRQKKLRKRKNNKLTGSHTPLKSGKNCTLMIHKNGYLMKIALNVN